MRGSALAWLSVFALGACGIQSHHHQPKEFGPKMAPIGANSTVHRCAAGPNCQVPAFAPVRLAGGSCTFGEIEVVFLHRSTSRLVWTIDTAASPGFGFVAPPGKPGEPGVYFPIVHQGDPTDPAGDPNRQFAVFHNFAQTPARVTADVRRATGTGGQPPHRQKVWKYEVWVQDGSGWPPCGLDPIIINQD